MAHLPPHLQNNEEELLEENFTTSKSSQIGPQGPSKYGKGGSRLYKAKGRAGRK